MHPFHKLSFAEPDERVRRNVFPTRVIQTRGQVTNASALLTHKALQITTNEPVVTTLQNGEDGENAAVLLDFGVEFNGAARLLIGWIQGPTVAQVRLCFGESVSEALSHVGEKGATNDHSTRDMVVAVPCLSDLELGETGYRFLFVELLSPNTSLPIKAITGVCIYRDLPYLGTFRCNRERLNQIFDTAAYTCHLNMQERIWDGVKRDRLVWVGDMHPETMTIRSVFGNIPMFADTIRFTRESTPLPGFMNGFATYTLWWLLIVRDWYWFSGDEAFLAEQKEYIKGLIPLVADMVGDDGSDRMPGHFLDWQSADKPQEFDGAWGLLSWALQAARQLAEIYGDEEGAALCTAKLEAATRRPVQHHGAKQTAAMLSLSGLISPEEAVPVILEGGPKGMSTFMSYYILKAAANGGDMASILAMLEGYYGGMLDMGATTFWEDFNIDWLENAAPIDEPVPPGKTDVHGDNGAYCYVGLRHSLCHGWSSGPTAFLMEEVLGIHIKEAGCRTIELCPQLGDLEWAEGSYPTPHGPLTVSHRRQADGSVHTTWDAPAGVQIILKPAGQ